MKNKYYLFDCMETIINIHDYKGVETDAFWSYIGSGLENNWNSFNHFFDSYIEAKKYFESSLESNKEYPLNKRFLYMASKLTKNKNEQILFANKLKTNFLINYKSRCYVLPNI